MGINAATNDPVNNDIDAQKSRRKVRVTICGTPF